MLIKLQSLVKDFNLIASCTTKYDVDKIFDNIQTIYERTYADNRIATEV